MSEIASGNDYVAYHERMIYGEIENAILNKNDGHEGAD